MHHPLLYSSTQPALVFNGAVFWGFFFKISTISDESSKQKWDEEDFEGEMEEDFEDDLADEGLPTGHDAVAPGKGILLLPHRQLHPHSQLLKARPNIDQEHHVSILPSHAPHSHLGGQDHGDWTYEEQFRQVPGVHISEVIRL